MFFVPLEHAEKAISCSKLWSMKDSDAHMTGVHLTGLRRGQTRIVTLEYQRRPDRVEETNK
jgi:predicted neuraminidase